MKLAAGTLCMQTLLTRSRVLLQTENVHIAQIDVHEYDSMAFPWRSHEGRHAAPLVWCAVARLEPPAGVTAATPDANHISPVYARGCHSPLRIPGWQKLHR